MAGTLFVVATPIGNLEDITFRAIRTLNEADLIASEDTRHTKILLDRYTIATPMTSYHKFNIRGKTRQLVHELQRGKNLALVSDAGTPGISDPGYELVAEASSQGLMQVALEARIPVINGVIVAENTRQAAARCGGSLRKGGEFAHAALEMAALHKKLSR